MGTPAPTPEAGSATQRALAELKASGENSMDALVRAFANAGATVIVGDANGTRQVLPEAKP